MNACFADLRKSTAIGTRVLQTYARDKPARPLHKWLFTLYAKVIGSARSMLLLLENRNLTDCPLVLRSLHDTSLDILYILSKPGEAK